MKTLFYKILYKNKDVIYVGVTTRTLKKRFLEHVKSKRLNTDNFNIVEIDRIIHPDISSLENYKEEYKKVSELEKYYISLYGGPEKLINISKGGEWGASLLHKLLKKDFFNRYGSYSGFEDEYKKKKKIVSWLQTWIRSYNISKTKVWLYNWGDKGNKNVFRGWLYAFIRKNIKDYNTKKWLRYWIKNKLDYKTKKWLRYWVYHRDDNKTKRWLSIWIKAYTKNKTKGWLFHWCEYKILNKTKRWLKTWTSSRSKNKTKIWIWNWWIHRTRNTTKEWIRNWIHHRSNKLIVKNVKI